MPQPSPAASRYRQILAERRPGESLAALARRARVNPRTLYWWRRRLASRAQGAEQSAVATAASLPALLPVDLTAELLGLAPPREPAPAFEVTLRASGHLLRVPAEFDPETLIRLVAALERR